MSDHNITYLASVTPLQAEGKRLAQVYVIDPTLNRAGWKAKQEAIERARASLMRQPLLYEPGPNEKADWVEADAPFWGGTHQGEWVRAGQPVRFDEGSDGSFHVTYDISSDHAWEDIVNRRARAASPSCEIYDAHLTRPRTGGPAELELNDLEFNHVLLIPPGGEGAYPNAGIENFWETQAAWSGFTGAVASAINQTNEVKDIQAFVQAKLTEEDLSLDNVWSTHDRAGERMNDYFDAFMKERRRHPDITYDEIWQIMRNSVKKVVEGKEMSTEENEETGSLLDAAEEEDLEAVLDQLGPEELDPEDLAVDAAKWAQKAVKKPGRVRRYLESRGLIKKGAPIPISLLQRLFKSTKDRSLKAAFLLAIRFKKGLTKKGVVGTLNTVHGNGELLAPEHAPIDRTTMSTQPDLQKQIEEMNTTIKAKDTAIAAKDAEMKARDAKILELEKSVKEAGLDLKAHEEGLGITHLQAKYTDSQAQNERLSKALQETKTQASLVEDMYRKVMVNKIVSARLEAGDIQPNEVDAYISTAMKLPADALDERLQDAERSAKKMRDLGLGRRETYGAGAALQPAKKDLGYTVGDLTGVYGGNQ